MLYEPYGKQQEFHCATPPTRALFGGNRSGKTTAGGMEFLFHITGMYPKWYPEENRFKPPVKGRIVAKDFQKGVGEVIIPFLDEWLDDSLVEKRFKNPLGIPVKWTLKNGSVFDIMTYVQNVEQFEGWKGHIAWFDEPPPRNRYVATRRGLVDFNGKNWLTLTPLKQPWIYDEIYVKSDVDRIYTVTVDIRDNPHLTEEAVSEFEKTLTVDEREARIHGKFMHLSGLIYKEFNPGVNVCNPIDIRPNWTRYFCIDPHPRTPTACLWLAVDPHGNHWIYDELWLSDLTIEEVSHAIHAQEGEYPPRFRFIDPAMDKENELAGGFNVRKELMKHGIYCQRANTDFDLGVSRIQNSLKAKYIPQMGQEAPVLRIFNTCERVLYEFTHYVWADRKANNEAFTPKQKPMKKNDHMMDNLRYIYNSDPRYVAQDSDEDDELEYTGTYARYPTKKNTGRTKSYNKLVEEKAGKF